MQREYISFKDKFYHLHEVKDIFERNIHNFSSINLNFFLNNENTKNIFEKEAFYLHFLIIFRTPIDVFNYLNSYYNKYGSYTTKMFINYPLMNIMEKNIITPIICAMLWSEDPEMIRALYTWGVDISMTDVNGLYAEELYLGISKYCNHLSSYVAPKQLIFGLRIKDNFKHIHREIMYIAGDLYPCDDDNWQLPARYII